MAEKPQGLERMTFFSDAVIAIMLTLLALELPVPDGDSFGALWHSLGEHADEYLAFGISFAVIAATWVMHHMLFTHVVRSDQLLITLNLLTLLAYVMVPWASKTLAETEGGAGFAVYSTVMAFLGLTMFLVVQHVARRGLLSADTPRSMVAGIRVWTLGTMLVFAITVPLSLFIGEWVQAVWAVGFLSLRLVAGFYTKSRGPAKTSVAG